MVHVHGHGQCGRCGTSVEPCCTGADAQGEADEPVPAWRLGPDVLPRLFAELGGEGRSVTPEALRFLLAHVLGVPLGEAEEVIGTALELGHLRRSGPGLRLGPASGGG